MGNVTLFGRRLAWLIFLILYSPILAALATVAELMNLVIKINREDLLIDLKIYGVLTNEMKKGFLLPAFPGSLKRIGTP